MMKEGNVVRKRLGTAVFVLTISLRMKFLLQGSTELSIIPMTFIHRGFHVSM